MSADKWSDRNKWLNAFRTAICARTHGLIRGLSVDVTDDDHIVIQGSARSYHSIQLVIHVTRQFEAESGLVRQVKLLLTIEGKSLELAVPRSLSGTSTTQSTPVVRRRTGLTVAAGR